MCRTILLIQKTQMIQNFQRNQKYQKYLMCQQYHLHRH
jgi:hypothetical protein